MTNQEKTAYQMARYHSDPEYRARILENKRRHRGKVEAKSKALTLLKQPHHRIVKQLRKRLDGKLSKINEVPYHGPLSIVLGCSLASFRKQFEGLFRDGMTWRSEERRVGKEC